jgi:hypothetical protein
MELTGLTELPSLVLVEEIASSSQTVRGHFDAESNASLLVLLSDPKICPEKLLGRLCETTELKTIFDEPTGYGSQTVRTHTLDVLRAHAALADFHRFESYEVNGVRLQATFTMMLALHDARKVQGGKCKTKQHQVTVAVLKRVMAERGFFESEVALAAALVGNGFIGDFLVNKVPVAEMKSRIDAVAHELSLSPKVLFRLSSHYYTVDAGAYPHLKANRVLFAEEDGRIFIAHPSWKELEKYYL